LKTRFQAWWSGTELPDLNGANDLDYDGGYRAPPEPIFPRADPAAEIGLGGKTLPPWGPYRIQAAGLVWGKGQVNPGDEEYIVDLVKIAALSPDMSVLEIGAGLGGAARIISERFGVWITALESSQFLVGEGMELSVMAGLSKKVPVTVFDPSTAELPEKKFKFIFSKDTFYRLENKTDWLDSIAVAMNQTAQFMITDIVTVGDNTDESPLTKSWRSSESDAIHLWSLDGYNKYFEGNKLSTLHAPLDITEGYCDAVVSGWWRAQQAMRKLKRSGRLRNRTV
jgi:SAM-dependent methyltransferase